MLQQFITSERPTRGYLRLGLVLFILLGMVIWSASLFTPSDRFPWILFTFQGLVFWIFPLAGFFAALWLAGRYVRDLYGLPTNRLGVRYVISTAFGLFMPAFSVDSDTRLNLESHNLLERIGGPGYVNVSPGNLVLLENQVGPSNVYPAGTNYVSRFEKIKEIASLEDQHGYIERQTATTKDGIQVVVSEIRYLYRMRPSRRGGEYVPRSPTNPFPYNLQAMRNYTYNRTVSHLGLTQLSMAMDIIVKGAITDYINAHRFDDLTTPTWDTDPLPRAEIWNNLHTKKDVQDRFRQYGMELQWVDIGHFDVDEEVWNWRVQTWGALWAGTASLPRSLGQVRRETYERIARAEGRADALKLLIQYLDDARLGGEERENLRKLILLYTAQIMDEMGRRPRELGNQAILGEQADLPARKTTLKPGDKKEG
jgi:hypothetical protein